MDTEVAATYPEGLQCDRAAAKKKTRPEVNSAAENLTRSNADTLPAAYTGHAQEPAATTLREADADRKQAARRPTHADATRGLPTLRCKTD